VRPLKRGVRKSRGIPGTSTWPDRTLYPISRTDATALLKAARTHLASLPTCRKWCRAGGQGRRFRNGRNNKRVERGRSPSRRASLQVSVGPSETCPPKITGTTSLHRVERGAHVRSERRARRWSTVHPDGKELNAWTTTGASVGLCSSALSAKPSLSFFPRATSQAEFSIRSALVMAKRQLNPHAQRGRRARSMPPVGVNAWGANPRRSRAKNAPRARPKNK